MGYFLLILSIILYIYYLKSKNAKQIELPEENPLYVYPEIKRINIANRKNKSICDEFIVIDFETTGLNPYKNEIIEIAAVKFKNGYIIDEFVTLVKPINKISREITKINNITNSMVKDSPTIEKVFSDFINFIGDNLLVMHNAKFDLGFLNCNIARLNLKVPPVINTLDTLSLSRKLLPKLKNHKLGTILNKLNIRNKNCHRAHGDAMATGQMLIIFLEMLKKIKL